SIEGTGIPLSALGTEPTREEHDMSVEAEVRKLRAKIDHPVVDGDGHIVESWPLFFRYLAKVGGSELQERFVRELKERPIFSGGDRDRGDPRMPWWGSPTE